MDASDIGVVLYASVAICGILTICVLAIKFRANVLVRVNNPRMIVLSGLGACVHILSELVTNGHSSALSSLEMSACALWGYWLPYVFGAGPFFVGLYLRLFTYTTAVSREFDVASAARARRWRWPVALAALLPAVFIAGLVSATPGATRPDAELGVCISEWGYKTAIGVWAATCIFALVVSVGVFRRGLVVDRSGEIGKQSLLAAVGIVVLTAVAFVMLFAEDGLTDGANRFIATFSVATLYVIALGVLGGRPLWRVYRHSRRGYAEVNTQELEGFTAQQQPVESVKTVIKFAADSGSTLDARAARILFADFITYCSLDSVPPMDRGNGVITPPFEVANFYSQMDFWTLQHIMAHGDMEAIDLKLFPPLVARDIVRSHKNIIACYFEATDGKLSKRDTVGISPAVLEATLRKLEAEGAAPPADLFAEAMWWAVDLLDEYYGKLYLTTDILRRDVFISAQNPSVRNLISRMRRLLGQKRMADAKLIVATDECNTALLSSELMDEDPADARNADSDNE